LSVQDLKNNQFFHHYQPIYDIQKWEIIGYEGLFRTENPSSPEIMFDCAKRKKELYELDSRSVHKALITYINAGYLLRYENLFLNVYPSTLINPLFQTLINRIINDKGITSQQVIFEINENDIVDLENLKEAIENLKKFGFRIAIDDFGKGFSSIQSIIELKPDFIKLDKYFTEGLLNSEPKKDVINFLHDFCHKFNSKLIIEGVEDNTCLALLKSMEIQFAQGYLLGRPALLKSEKYRNPPAY
jgi:EAL domain-containing protein (putative c-di-GMP-specific phosphodiesterase class I)